MAVTLEQFKNYLRIDTDWEDDLLQQFLDTAVDYLKAAVSNYDDNYNGYPVFASKADLLTMVIAAEYYQNRDNSPHSLSYTIQSMIVQLQYFADDIPADSDTAEVGGYLGNGRASNTANVG